MFERNKSSIAVCVCAVLYVGFLFLLGWVHGDAGDLRIIRLTEGFALGAVAVLYIALLPILLYEHFPAIPGKNFWIPAKPALYLVAFIFGLTHSSLAFFKLFKTLKFSGFISPIIPFCP